MKTISLIVPCYNEEESINLFYTEARKVIDSLPEYRFEMIFVDDGSRDDTIEKIDILAAGDPRVKGIELSRNFGKEAAMTAGIFAAKGDAVIPMDVELQDPPRDYSRNAGKMAQRSRCRPGATLR